MEQDSKQHYYEEYQRFKIFLSHRESNQNNKNCVPPPPRHRDPSQEFINMHHDWNKTSASLIKTSLANYDLTAAFSDMSYCNDSFAENDILSIRRPINKDIHFREILWQNFNKKYSPQVLTAYAETVWQKCFQHNSMYPLQ